MTGPLFVLGLIGALAFGVSIGSFLNVVIWRVPRGESVASPKWSYCPNCRTRLGGWDLVPIASFLLLGRKCRYCKQPISWRYITVETITGVLFALIFLRYLFSIDTVFYCLFASVLVSAFFIDLDYFIIPDELNVLGFILGVALNIGHYWIDPPAKVWRIGHAHILASIPSAVVCALIFHAISLLGYIYYSQRTETGVDGKESGPHRPHIVMRLGRFLGAIADDYVYLAAKFTGLGAVFPRVRHFIAQHELEDDAESDRPAQDSGAKSREQIAEEIEQDDEQTGMGQGDAKLAAAIGSVLLLKLALVGIFLAIVIGGAASAILVVVGRRRGHSAIPFGPYIVAGALISMFVGQDLLNWYVRYAFPVTTSHTMFH